MLAMCKQSALKSFYLVQCKVFGMAMKMERRRKLVIRLILHSMQTGILDCIPLYREKNYCKVGAL